MLLLQSKEQVRNNNAREVAHAFRKFFDVVLPSYPEFDKKECYEFVKRFETLQLTRGQKRKILPLLEAGVRHPWALPVFDMVNIDEKLPKKRRIN